MNILITGGQGQLGSDVIEYLKINNLTDNILAPSSAELNIIDKKQVDDFFAIAKPDLVIHCAAYTAVDKAENEILQCTLTNIVGTANIVINCKKFNSELIYISTDYVYDGQPQKIYTEESPKKPLSWYGITKSKGEDIVMCELEKYFILRTSWVYGKNGNNFVKAMLNFAKLGRTEIDVVEDEIGSPTYTKDLAKYMLAIYKTKKYGIYNIHNSGYVSRADFARKIFELAGLDIKVNGIPTKNYQKMHPQIANRPLNNKLSLDKLNSLLYFEAKIPSWDHSLANFLVELAKSSN